MREIKFRVWNSKKQTMENKSALAFGKNGVILYDYEQLMQYTGLKDKYNIEIYEGDIVKTNLYNINGCVYYSAPSFGIKQKNGICTDYNWSDFNNFEIIGNIYENKELLK